MLYNWSKILNACSWARVAVMNKEGERVFLFDTKEVQISGGGWIGPCAKRPWESITGVLISQKRPKQEDSYEAIPDIYLANLEGE